MILSLSTCKVRPLTRLIQIVAVILILSSLLTVTLPSRALALSNSTTVGTLELVPAYENIGVHSHFSGDDNDNNSATLRYRPNGSSVWKAGVELYKDTRSEVIQVGLAGEPIEGPYGVPNPYQNEYRGIIFGLQPNTDYEVEVVYTDPDGVSGTARSVVRTLNDNPPSTGNNYWVDPARGNDENPGTQQSPWATVQHAADSVSAGDTVNISGTITEGGSAYAGRGIQVWASGTPNNYITFQSADPADMATFDGEGTRWHAFQLFGSYIRIRNLIMTNFHGDPGGAVVIGGREDEGDDLAVGNIVENCLISDPGGSWACAGILLRYSEASLIQNNEIYATPYGDRASSYGIFFFGTIGKNVVRDNYIHSDASFKDSIGGISNFSMDGGPGPDSFIYDNYIYGSWDDGIEIEGGNCNVAVWGNIIKNNDVDIGGASMNMGFGISSTIVGPLYVMRNVIINAGDATFKIGTHSYGPMYIYHNTVYGDQGGAGIGHFGNDAIAENYHVLNNIFYLSGGGRCVENWYNQFIEGNDWYPVPGSVAGITYDNNCWWTTRNEYHFSVAWLRADDGSGAGHTYELPGTWQTELGFDINGIVDEPEFVNPGTDNFSLTSGSPCINTGCVIQGINDTDSPWPYSGSAPDIGAYEYGSGGPTNRPPVLSTIGNKSVNVGQALQFTISATDQDGDALTYSASNLPSGATFNAGTRTFSWTPTSGQAGTYSNVHFQVSDGSLTDFENITITVPGDSNGPPVLNAIGNKSVNEGELLQFTVSATDPDGDTLTYSASNLPAGSTFNAQTRTFSWTPASGQRGSYLNVHFEVTDGELTDFENISINVLSESNGPPVLNAIGNKSVNEGELLQFTVSATDPDGDTLTYSASNLPSGATFNAGTRTFSWTPTSSQVGSYPNVHFEVSDGELIDSENITITVTSAGDYSPLLRVNAGGSEYTDTQGNTWEADQAYSSGSWGFYGPDNTSNRGPNHSISGTTDDYIYQTERWGLSGYRFDVSNGTYTVTLHFAETYRTGPGQRVFDVSIEGQLVLDNLDIYSEVGYSTALTKVFNGIVVQDGQLNIAFASSIEQPEINGIEIEAASDVNNAPILSPIGNRSVSEDELLQFAISATDPDDDPLTYSASNLPAGATFNPTIRTFSWTPTSSQVGSYPNVRFEVSDGSLTDFENITINVLSGDNRAPVLDAIGNKSVGEGGLLQFAVSATDPDGDALTYSAFNLPDGAIFNAQTRTFSWTPELGQRGSYSYVRFNVTDGALSDFEYITITVITNDPPVLDTIGNKSVREDEELEFTISAIDPDGDPLTFSAYNLPQGASFDAESRTFSWAPDSSDIGTHNNVHFEVTDGTWTDTEDITITVLGSANNAPVLNAIGSKSINEGELLEFTISATDPEDDPLTFSASNLPEGATFDPETSNFSWTPVTGDADTYENVHFEVSDGELTDSEDITITVNIPTPPDGGGGGGTGGDDADGGGGGGVGGDFVPYYNAAPVLNAIGSKSVNEGELLEFTISATDPDGDPLTFSASGLPQGATFNAQTRTFSWTPGPGMAGTYAGIYFEVSDGELTDAEVITITVGSTTVNNTQQDEAPPVIQGVAASEAATDSVEIRWTTTEPSTSQVEYWASPSKFSPLDETLVTEHVVRLIDLAPGTDYHYRTLSQDEAGNLATSPEYSFTTLGTPTTFAVRWLSISPAEADIGEEVTISVLVTNTGDIAGSYDVTLSIDDTVEATESVIDLAGGGSQEVAFTITRETAGEYTVSVNGATGSLVVREADLLEPTITLFKIRPIYEADTGVITFTRIDCQINEAYYSMLFSQLGAELVLKVGLDDKPLEEVILFSPEQSEPAASIDGLNYAPAEGWTAGTYTFQAELRTTDGVVETSPAEELVITAAAAAAVVSWATLGEIIGGVLIIALFAMLFILHRNRDMLRAYT